MISRTEALFAFNMLKSKLVDPSVLILLKVHRQYVIDFGASVYLLGATLFKQQNNSSPNKWATIGYQSRTVNHAKQYYSATDKEGLAVVWSIQAPRSCKEGLSFKIRMGRNGLKQMVTCIIRVEREWEGYHVKVCVAVRFYIIRDRFITKYYIPL